MNARTLLIPRTLLILSLVVLSGAPCASAQSFKERLKNAAKKIEQKVKQEVAPKKLPEKSGNTSSLDSELQKRHDAMVGPDNNKNAEDEAPTVRLPETHTALFAPLGYPVEATYGIKKDVQDNPSLQKTIPMSAPDRSSPLKGKNDRR